jgi:hypothetical protein
MSITVKGMDGAYIGMVSQFGTTHIALEGALRRASKLVADHYGFEWAVAWQSGSLDNPLPCGTIGIRRARVPGLDIARWWADK